jgi:hypothetical protein
MVATAIGTVIQAAASATPSRVTDAMAIGIEQEFQGRRGAVRLVADPAAHRDVPRPDARALDDLGHLVSGGSGGRPS